MTSSNPYPGLDLRGLAVAEAQRARVAYMAALQRAQHSFPELHVMVSATPVGMRLIASIYYPGERFQRRVEVLDEAVWTPREVTDVAVVDWAQRCLAKWLAGHVERRVAEQS